MSCRVLKRDMEYAMMNEFVRRCAEKGALTVKGFYYPTEKNSMVKDFYSLFGFKKVSEDGAGNTVWEVGTKEYKSKEISIEITGR